MLRAINVRVVRRWQDKVLDEGNRKGHGCNPSNARRKGGRQDDLTHMNLIGLIRRVSGTVYQAKT